MVRKLSPLLIFTFLLALVYFSLFPRVYAKEPKTVCSMTINSDDEIKLFKKYLSREHVQFVELVDSDNPSWFQSACESSIKCDVLVVSGHFGGIFFGTQGQLDLTEIENKQCQNSCSNILSHNTEVYLFGCNTLAGKNKDHRTPEQYYQVLIEDGLSPWTAAQTTSARYSDLGFSFQEKMQNAFYQTPRIYGFHSVAPTGPRIYPYLESYLKNHAQSVVNSWNNAQSFPNRNLRESLSIFSFRQTKGTQKPPYESLQCRFLNSKQQEKLDLLKEMLYSDSPTAYIPHAIEYLKNSYKIPAIRRQLKEEFSGLEKTLKPKLERTIPSLLFSLRKQIEIIQTIGYLGWENEQTTFQKIDSTILSHIQRMQDLNFQSGPILHESEFCNLDLNHSINLNLSSVDKNLFNTYLCLPNTDLILLKEAIHYLNDPTQTIQNKNVVLKRLTFNLFKHESIETSPVKASQYAFEILLTLLPKNQQNHFLSPATLDVRATRYNALSLLKKYNQISESQRQELKDLLAREPALPERIFLEEYLQ